MSYFAALTPITGSSEYAPATYTQSQDPMIKTISKNFFSVITASIDMNVAGQGVLFTTAADRGRFFPTQVVVVADIVSQSSFNGPTLGIGQTSPNYYDWVNATLTTPQYTQYASGQYEFPVMANVYAQTLSAAPNRDIYYKITNPTNSCDKRSIILMGFYTGNP